MVLIYLSVPRAHMDAVCIRRIMVLLPDNRKQMTMLYLFRLANVAIRNRLFDHHDNKMRDDCCGCIVFAVRLRKYWPIGVEWPVRLALVNHIPGHSGICTRFLFVSLSV